MVNQQNFIFPEVTNSKEALNSLFKIINDHATSTLVNVYVTYGTTAKPSQYLSTRYFNFVENASTPANMTRLKSSANDMMEKLVADAPSTDSSAGTSTTANW